MDIFEEIAEVADSMLDGLLERDGRGSRVMAVDSRAMFELNAESSWVDEDCEEPLSAARQIGHVSLVVARDFFWGAAEAAAGRSKLAVFPVARSSIEASERAYYLLQPDLDLAERVRRGVTERASTLKEQHGLLKVMSSDNPEAPQANDVMESLRRRVARYADTHGFLPEKRKWQSFPEPADRGGSATSRVQSFLADADDGWTQRGAFVYKQLCAPTHANSLFLEILGEKVDDLVSGLPARRFNVDPEVILRVLLTSLRALHQAESVYFQFNGWESPDDLILPVSEVLLAELA